MNDWDEKLQNSPWGLPLVSYGLSGYVFALDEDTVIKHFLESTERGPRHHQIERKIFKRLGHHPRIVKCISFHEKGILLEKLECPLRARLLEQQPRNERPTDQQVLKWSQQVAEGFRYLHAKGVFQVDVGCHNILLTKDDDIKLNDFAGSAIDDDECWVYPGCHTGFHLFRDVAAKPTVDTELYSLGCLMYEMSTTRQPYHDKTEKEIEDLLDAGIFPTTDNLLLGRVIHKCWTSQYTSVQEVEQDIIAMTKITEASPRPTKRECDDDAHDRPRKQDGSPKDSRIPAMASTLMMVALVVIFLSHFRSRYPIAW